MDPMQQLRRPLSVKSHIRVKTKSPIRDLHESLAAKDTGSIHDHREKAGPRIRRDVHVDLTRDPQLAMHVQTRRTECGSRLAHSIASGEAGNPTGAAVLVARWVVR